jgi:hypothetical protein
MAQVNELAGPYNLVVAELDAAGAAAPPGTLRRLLEASTALDEVIGLADESLRRAAEAAEVTGRHELAGVYADRAGQLFADGSMLHEASIARLREVDWRQVRERAEEGSLEDARLLVAKASWRLGWIAHRTDPLTSEAGTLQGRFRQAVVDAGSLALEPDQVAFAGAQAEWSGLLRRLTQEQRAAFQPERALAPAPGTQAELEALVDRYADQLNDARELAKRAARMHPQPSSFQKLGTWAHELFIGPSDKKRRRR